MKTNLAAVISNSIKAEAMRLGFSACGIARAEVVDAPTQAVFNDWLKQGGNAEMEYMTNYPDLRFDPRQLLPGCQSVISLALNYFPSQKLTSSQCQFAYYAYGKDYHDVMRRKMQQLAEFIDNISQQVNKSTGQQVSPTRGDSEGSSFRLCVDTAPILERYWAERAGIGWIGKNHLLIIPGKGSFHVLGEILTTIPLIYDEPMTNRCGDCTRCLQVCPNKALHLDGYFDSSHCLSYLSIEYRGQFDSPDKARSISNLHPYIYGCDRCQLVCPHNREAEPTRVAEFHPTAEFLGMTPADWQSLTLEQYQRLFRGSAVKRVKYAGLKRNIDMK
ncbi:MAG: tRNA epoxyqueuosine(34) reductase QueG [Bacteroidaceae bacterium]|nr:tRNA epoxyqueuosine(34) reductase QueG [Bacteroidaceae bacterium]